MIWSVAAWELYKYTGDKEWLQYAFEVIRNSAQDDQFTLKDPTTGLSGESKVISTGENNLILVGCSRQIFISRFAWEQMPYIVETYGILAEMAAELGKDASIFQQQPML